MVTSAILQRTFHIKYDYAPGHAFTTGTAFTFEQENEKSLQSDPIEDESSKISSPTTLLDEMEVQTTHANSSLKSNTPPQNTTEVSKNSIQAGRVEEEESNESYQSAMPLNKEVEAKHSEPISLKNNGQKLNVPRRFLGKALIAIAVVFTAIVFFKGLTYYVDDLKQKDLKRSRMANRDLNSAACKDLDLDLSIGTLNGLKPSDDPAKIVAKLPCWLKDATAPGFYTEKASAGGKITYSSFIFYTCQDFLEVKKSFSGKVKFGVLDQPLLFVETVFGTNYEKITRQESRYECIYSMEYGALGVQFFNSRVELIRIYGRNYKDYKYDPVSSANKCD